MGEEIGCLGTLVKGAFALGVILIPMMNNSPSRESKNSSPYYPQEGNDTVFFSDISQNVYFSSNDTQNCFPHPFFPDFVKYNSIQRINNKLYHSDLVISKPYVECDGDLQHELRIMECDNQGRNTNCIENKKLYESMSKEISPKIYKYIDSLIIKNQNKRKNLIEKYKRFGEEVKAQKKKDSISFEKYKRKIDSLESVFNNP